jgi:DNA-binding transcriptional LysR family regulator
MYPGVELRVMRYIVAVAKELHFGRAADKVHIAQPSLSKQIRLTEEELGFSIFNRHNRRVEISDPGAVFIENAEQALLYAERAVALSRSAAAGDQGKLLLGVSPVIRQETFFRMRSAYQAQYPEIEMCLLGQFSGQQAEMIMRNELHAGLIELPIRYRGLSVINLIQEPLAIAVAQNDPLAKEVAVNLKALEGRVLALVSPDVDLSNSAIEEFLVRTRLPVARIVKLPMPGQLIDYVLHENGVAIVRDNWTHWQTTAISFRPLLGLPPIYTGLAYRRDNRSSVVRNLTRFVRQMFGQERQHMMSSAADSRQAKDITQR